MSLFNRNKSEVARLRQQIEDECEAMSQAMNGFANTASHEFIQQRYENMGAARNDLARFVGEEEASEIMTRAYSRKMDGGRR